MTVVLEHTARPALSGSQQTAAIITRTLADRWRSLVGWGVGLVAIAVLQLAVYPSVASSAQAMQDFVNQWPEAFREAFELDAYSTGAGFLNAEMFSLVIPLVLIAVATAGAGAATAGEEERGTADVLFALPVSRWRVLLAKAVSVALSVVVLAGVIAVVLLVGAPLVDLDVSAAGLISAVAMLSLLALAFGAFGLLVGALTGSRVAVLGAGLGLALASFLLNVLAPMADWLEPWQRISPFSWALSANPLVNGMDWPMAVLFATLTLAGLLAAGSVFRRRDLRSR